MSSAGICLGLPSFGGQTHSPLLPGLSQAVSRRKNALPANFRGWAPRIWSHTRLPILSCAAEDGGTPPKKGFGFKGKEKAGAAEAKKLAARKRLEQEGVLLSQGPNAGAAAAPEKKGSRRLSKVVDIVDKKSSVRSSIDPAQAKLGKVDFVRVQNWGAEDDDSQKLEDLQIKSFSPAASSVQNKSNGPFYEKLVNRLQLLESKGDITVAQAKRLPSFDRWVFGEYRYVQFLVDQRSVFEALRDGIGAVCSEKCRRMDGKLEEVVLLGGAASAIALFDVELGLDRCQALSADISSFINSSRVGGEARLESMTASTQAVGYAKYIKQLGRMSIGDGKKAKEACLKLLAHLFAVYVSHLTTGMRIGAKALDNVSSLKQTKALSFYRDYPLEGKDPLKLFMTTINSAGTYIVSEDDQEQVMDELAKAFQRTSLLISVLAVVEEQMAVAHD